MLCFILFQSNRQSRAFLREMLSTQLFSSFVQRRTQSSDPRLVFFDYCVHAAQKRRKQHRESYGYIRYGGEGGWGAWRGRIEAPGFGETKRALLIEEV